MIMYSKCGLVFFVLVCSSRSKSHSTDFDNDRGLSPDEFEQLQSTASDLKTTNLETTTNRK